MGRRGLEWQKVLRQIKPKFEALGITFCEYHGASCRHNWCLTFAHARKRRHLLPGELKIAALVCAPYHNEIEALPPREMHRIVMEIIMKRETQPVEIPDSAHHYHLDIHSLSDV
jgi:hypothetical protein